MAQGKPTLHLIVGPEGSGKTTFYEQILAPSSRVVPELRSRYVSAETVAAPDGSDPHELARRAVRSHLSEGRSVTYETAFTHARELDLVTSAKASGTRIVITQLQTQSPELAFARVQERVREGGRDASAAQVRGEFETSPALVARAARSADTVRVYDTSALNQDPRQLLTLEAGRVTKAAPIHEIPAWARSAYQAPLESFRDQNISSAERSFAAVLEKAEQRVANARVTIAGRQDGSFEGPVVAKSRHHLLQQTGEREFVAHLQDRVAVSPPIDQAVRIVYTPSRSEGRPNASVEFQGPRAPQTDSERQAEARVFLNGAGTGNARVAAALAASNVLQDIAWEFGAHSDRAERENARFINASLARGLAEGKRIEINAEIVSRVREDLALRNLQSVLDERIRAPERNARLDPEQRRFLIATTERVGRSEYPSEPDEVARARAARTADRPIERRAIRDASQAERVAAQLARHDGPNTPPPFTSPALRQAYEAVRTEALRQSNRAGERSASVARGIDR